MMQKHRILTNLGKDQKIVLELKQEFDLIEILSLKFTQSEAYTSICSDYGVVCGRISANEGFGIPNARVSIFIPQKTEDENDPVISALYPFKSFSDRNDEGYKYNLLPSRKQHSGHTPTGTFPDQTDILNREEYLEVYEKYYKYTCKTNQAGDFMIWGIPVGTQILHVDIDLSDIGCQSMVPYDFIYEGISEQRFENKYTFLSSQNIDTLPQIITFDKTIEVFPFWGNEDLCEIGITRSDFDLGTRGVRIQPYALMMGGTMTDSGKDSLRANCNVDNQMGEKCRLQTSTGDIESIRFTGDYEKDINGNPNKSRPILENYAIDSTIDEDGVFFYKIPMNLDYFVTNERGEMVLSKEKKGIPTRGIYRFRFSLGEDTGSVNSFTAKILVPNLREYHNNDTSFIGGYTTIDPKSYTFSTNINDYPKDTKNDGTINSSDGSYVVAGLTKEAFNDNLIGIPQDYFYQFGYGRVYTITQFINKYFKTSALEKVFSFVVRDRNESFIGIKEILPSEDCSGTNNYFPINDAVRNHRFSFFIIQVLSAIEYIQLVLNLFIKESVTRVLFSVAGILGDTGVSNEASAKMFRRAKEYQFNNIFKLNLIVYPDCYDCTEDNEITETEPNSIDINITDYIDTSPTFSNFKMFERYSIQVSTAICDTYNLTNSTTNSKTVSYVACDGLVTSVLVVPFGSTSVNGYPGQTSTFTSVGLGCTVIAGGGGSTYGPDENLYFQNSTPVGYVPSPLPPSQTTQEGDLLRQIYILEIEILSGNIEYITVGFGQPYEIVYEYSTGLWKILGLYGYIAQVISEAFNKPYDEVVPNTCHTQNGIVFINNIWLVDGDVTPSESTYSEVETGCQKYDYIIEDELNSFGSMQLSGITAPILGNQFPNTFSTYSEVMEYYNTYQPNSCRVGTPHTPTGQLSMWRQLDSDYNDKVLGINDYATGDCEPIYDYSNLLGVASVYIKRPLSNDECSFRNGVGRCIYNGAYYGEMGRKGPYWVDEEARKKGTLTGLSEFRDGVYTIVPLAGKTFELINSYIRRKLFGQLMCGGVTSYTFSNGWLNGVLYFFRFRKRGDDKFCKDCIYKKVESDGTINYYYRSTPYNPTYSAYESQGIDGTSTDDEGRTYNQIYSGKTLGFYGTRRNVDMTQNVVNPLTPLTVAGWVVSLGKLLSNNIYRKRDINFPTTILDLGPRNTWIAEICCDKELDVNYSVVRSLGSTSYKNIDDLMEYVIQSKEIKEKGRLRVQDLFDRRGFGLIDGDIAQLLNINSQVGIYGFENEDTESPYYIGYTDTFDSKGPIGIDFVYSEDDPDTEIIEANGYFVRSFLNKPNRLGDYSQRVPYYMWETRGSGFGEDNAQGENQTFFTAQVYNQRIQKMKANINLTIGDDLNDTFQDGYVLPPIRDCIDTGSGPQKSNDNYRDYQVDGTTRYLMELGGPFHYMFGIRKGKTAFDKFIENFGPK